MEGRQTAAKFDSGSGFAGVRQSRATSQGSPVYIVLICLKYLHYIIYVSQILFEA